MADSSGGKSPESHGKRVQDRERDPALGQKAEQQCCLWEGWSGIFSNTRWQERRGQLLGLRRPRLLLSTFPDRLSPCLTPFSCQLVLVHLRTCRGLGDAVCATAQASKDYGPHQERKGICEPEANTALTEGTCRWGCG